MGRITWRKQIGQGPGGALLAVDGKEAGRTYARYVGTSARNEGWYWVARSDAYPVPHVSTRNDPVATPGEAMDACEAYVRKCVGLPKKKARRGRAERDGREGMPRRTARGGGGGASEEPRAKFVMRGYHAARWWRYRDLHDASERGLRSRNPDPYLKNPWRSPMDVECSACAQLGGRLCRKLPDVPTFEYEIRAARG